MPPRATSTATTLMLAAVQAEVKLVKVTSDKTQGVSFDRILDPPVGENPAPPALAADPENPEIVFSGSSGGTTTATADFTAPDKRYGVTREDGTVVDVTEILERVDESVKLEGMEVEAFVERRSFPVERTVGCYWVAPNGLGAGKVLDLVRLAMMRTNRVALVRWSKRTNQALGVIVPHKKGLVLMELAFAAASRPAPVLPPSASAITDTEVSAAVALIRAMSDRPVVVEEMEDERMELRKLVREHALEGTLDEMDVPGAPEDVDVDVVSAFRAALGD